MVPIAAALTVDATAVLIPLEESESTLFLFSSIFTAIGFLAKFLILLGILQKNPFIKRPRNQPITKVIKAKNNVCNIKASIVILP